MSECIFGIKCNGVSISVNQISIDSDQSGYDYICNVSLKNSSNGNGTYDVSIINKDYIQGMPVGKWRIKNASIFFNWGTSSSYFVMEDEDGNESIEIKAGEQKGSTSGFDLPSLTRAIFTKAQEVVRDYPNAKVYNFVSNYYKSSKDLNIDYFLRTASRKDYKSDDEYIGFIEYATSKLNPHLKVYKETIELLSVCEDTRTENLIKEIKTDCLSIISHFKHIFS